MRNIICIICLLFCNVCTFAQQGEAEKKAKSAIPYNNKIIDALEKTGFELSQSCNQLKKDSLWLADRTFTPSNGEEGLKNFLTGYKNLNAIFQDGSNATRTLKRHKSTLAKAYLKLIEMSNSLTVIYDESKNAELKTNIDFVKKNLLPNHKDGFDDLATNINDYRDIVEDLLRVYGIIDKMGQKSSKDIIEKLNNDAELYFINKITYTKDAVDIYAKSGYDDRQRAKDELNKSLGRIKK